jgi:hypothetical protein
MREAEVRSLGAIAAASIARPSTVAREVHGAVAGRVFSALGPIGIAARAIHDRASAVVYRGVGAALPLIPRAAGAAVARASGPDARALADSPNGSLALAVLNGFAGDRLVRDHPALGLELELRERGGSVAVEPAALAAAYPGATERLVVFVHGLCETETAWRLGVPGAAPRPTYGELLREELGFTPIYVRYNTGLHVSDNGRRLASTLEGLVRAWPVEAREIALIGHSMGGLVGDLLVHYASASGHGRRRRIGFTEENGRHLSGAHHLQLLNHPAVHDALRGWLSTERALAGPER